MYIRLKDFSFYYLPVKKKQNVEQETKECESEEGNIRTPASAFIICC